MLIRLAYFSNSIFVINSDDIEEKLSTSRKVKISVAMVTVKVRAIMVVDSVFVIISALLGTSPTTPFVESATGITVGARTGLASVVCGLLFLVFLPLGPIVPFITSEATGPALIITALLLIPFLKRKNELKSQSVNFIDISWDKLEELLPATFTMIMIPFTYSIADGAALGYFRGERWLICSSYCLILVWIFIGKWRNIKIANWVLIVVSILQLASSYFYKI